MNIRDVKPEDKIMIVDKVIGISSPDYCTVDEMIEQLQNAKKVAEEKGFVDLKIEDSYEYHSHYWRVEGKRLETDQEARARITQENIRKSIAAERELQEYERLKEKFG